MALKTYSGKVLNFKYSTEEQWTGDYWIDGKKIYSKVFTIASSANYCDINLTSLNADTVFIGAKSLVITKDGNYYPLNKSTGGANEAWTTETSTLTKNRLYIAVGNGISVSKYIAVVEYTCTNR